MEENQELILAEEKAIKELTDFGNSGNVNVATYTNVTDKKELFNLESSVDFKINDCIGEKIRVKKILVRTFDKPMKEPIVDEETGEILKSIERKVSCVLVDDNGKSYATGSKTFTYNLMNYLRGCDGVKELEAGIEIQVINVPSPNGNKALSFKLV